MNKKKMKLLGTQTVLHSAFSYSGAGGGHIQAFTGLIKVVIKTRKLKCDVSMKNRQHVSLNIELFLTHVKEKR